MNAKIKRQWLKELRSGEWVQGRMQLMDDQDRACCLGVLCDMAVRAGVVRPWFRRENGRWDVRHDGYGAFPPDEVLKWAGLDAQNPMVGDHELGVYNDGNKQRGVKQCDFPQIADLIETHL